MPGLLAQCQAQSRHLMNVEWINDQIVSLCKIFSSYKNSCIWTGCLGGARSSPHFAYRSPSRLGSFSVEILPQHAATCGETSPPHLASPSSSPPSSPSVLWVSSSESSSPMSWIQCPICQLQFSAGEVEEHASMCGEVPQAWAMRSCGFGLLVLCDWNWGGNLLTTKKDSFPQDSV